MMRLNKLSKWTAIVLSALALGYFAFDKLVLSQQQEGEFSGSATLSWVPPTENEDDSPLTDLAGYAIHYSIQEGQSSETIYIDDPGITTYRVENLAPGTYYFSISAIDSNGGESSLSNVIAKTIP
jgi:hypothetical protein